MAASHSSGTDIAGPSVQFSDTDVIKLVGRWKGKSNFIAEFGRDGKFGMGVDSGGGLPRSNRVWVPIEESRLFIGSIGTGFGSFASYSVSGDELTFEIHDPANTRIFYLVREGSGKTPDKDITVRSNRASPPPPVQSPTPTPNKGISASEGLTDASLIGRWIRDKKDASEDEREIEFRADHTFIEKKLGPANAPPGEDDRSESLWALIDTRTVRIGRFDFEADVSGDTLTLSGNFTNSYRRESVSETAPQAIPVEPHLSVEELADRVIGTWLETDEQILYEFYEDGTAVEYNILGSIDYTWKFLDENTMQLGNFITGIDVSEWALIQTFSEDNINAYIRQGPRLEVFPDILYEVSSDDQLAYIVARIYAPDPDNPGEEIPVDDGAVVEWETVTGAGTLSRDTTETRFGLATVRLDTTTTPGETYVVEATVSEVEVQGEPFVFDSGLTISSEPLTVVPGRPESIVLTQSVAEYHSDGTDSVGFEATVFDAAGNLVSDDTSVFWLVDNSTSGFIYAQPSTINGKARAILRAPILPVDQTVEVSSGLVISSATICVSRVAGGLTSSKTALDVSEGEIAMLTASVNAADGTAVFWTTSNGEISGATNVNNSQATADLSSDGGRIGDVVVTATIGDRLLIWEGNFVSSSKDLTAEVERFVLVVDADSDGVEPVSLPDGSTVPVPYWASTPVHLRGNPNSFANVSLPGGVPTEAYTFDLANGNEIPGRIAGHEMAIGTAVLDENVKHLGVGSLRMKGDSRGIIADAPAFDFMERMRVSLWVRPSTLNPSTLFSKDGAWGLEVLPSGVIRTTVHTTSGQFSIDSSTSLPLEEWSFVKLEVDAGTISLTLNSETVSEATVSGSILTNDQAIEVGAGFKGHIDDLLFSDEIEGTSLIRYSGVDAAGQVILDSSGQGTFRVSTVGLLGAGEEISTVTLTVSGSPEYLLNIYLTTIKRMTDVQGAVAAFFGADAETNSEIVYSIAGGMFVVGDIGAIVKNLWRMAGFSDVEPNHAELVLSALGVLTTGIVPVDAAIGAIKVIVVRFGKSPLAEVVSSKALGYARTFDVPNADQALLKTLQGSDDATIESLKFIDDVPTFDVVAKANAALGDEFVTAIGAVSKRFGDDVAERTTHVLADLPDDVLKKLKDSGRLSEASEGLATTLKRGINTEDVQLALTNRWLYTEKYTPANLLIDMGDLADVKGLDRLVKMLKTNNAQSKGFRYELEGAAQIKRAGQLNGKPVEVVELSKRVYSPTPVRELKTNIDVVIREVNEDRLVYLQFKRSVDALGYGKEQLKKTQVWVSKAMADLGTQDYSRVIYVVPPETRIPPKIREWFGDPDRNIQVMRIPHG